MRETLAASLVGKQQAAELGSDEPQADLVPGQLIEQTWQFPGGEVGIPGAEDAYEAKFPKAKAKITDDLDQLLAFMTTRPSTGSTYARPTQSNLHSPRSGTGPRSPKDPAPAPPTLYVPRIASTALTSRVARPALRP